MAGYDDGEALILGLVQGLTNYNTTNTTQGDWRVLDQGQDVRFAILKPGPHSSLDHTMDRVLDIYRTTIEVWAVFKVEESDAQNLINLEGYVNEIVDGLRPYNRLGDSGQTILKAMVAEVDEVEEHFNDQGGLEWLKQEVHVEWQEERTYTFQDAQ
jgi:hypothetical protein